MDDQRKAVPVPQELIDEVIGFISDLGGDDILLSHKLKDLRGQVDDSINEAFQRWWMFTQDSPSYMEAFRAGWNGGIQWARLKKSK